MRVDKNVRVDETIEVAKITDDMGETIDCSGNWKSKSKTKSSVKKSMPKKKNRSVDSKLSNSTPKKSNKFEKYFLDLEETVEATIAAKKWLQKENYEIKMKLLELENTRKYYENVADILKIENEKLITKVLEQNEQMAVERQKIIKLQVAGLRTRIHDGKKVPKSIKDIEDKNLKLTKIIKKLTEENGKLNGKLLLHNVHENRLTSTPLTLKTNQYSILGAGFSTIADKTSSAFSSNLLTSQLPSDLPLPESVLPIKEEIDVDFIKQETPDDTAFVDFEEEPEYFPKPENNNNPSVPWELSTDTINLFQETGLYSAPKHIPIETQTVLNSNKMYNLLLTELEEHVNYLIEKQNLPYEVLVPIFEKLFPSSSNPDKKNTNDLRNLITRFSNKIVTDIYFKKNNAEDLIEAPNVKKIKDLIFKIIRGIDNFCPDLSVIRTVDFELAKSLSIEIFKNSRPKDAFIENFKKLIETFRDYITKTIEDNRKDTFMDYHIGITDRTTGDDHQVSILTSPTGSRAPPNTPVDDSSEVRDEESPRDFYDPPSNNRDSSILKSIDKSLNESQSSIIHTTPIVKLKRCPKVELALQTFCTQKKPPSARKKRKVTALTDITEDSLLETSIKKKRKSQCS